MKTKDLLQNWIPLIAILLLGGLLTAVWPVLVSTGAESTAVSIPNEAEVIHLPFSAPLFGEEVTSVQALGLLAGVVVAPVLVVSGVLALIFSFAANQTIAATNTDEYKVQVAALEKRSNEQIKLMRQGRTTDPEPSHKMPRWVTFSTAFMILFIVSFAAMLVNVVFYPTNEMANPFPALPYFGHPTLITSAYLMVGIPFLVTLLFLAWRLRSQKIFAVDATDNGAIPWDVIWVIISGLLVVGLGIGLIVYLNVPL